MTRDPRIVASLLATALVLPALAAEEGAPIQAALESVDPDVLEYHDHVTVLSSPFMEGRLPGTQGMERAKDYMEMYLREAGLMPAFGLSESAEGSFRQAFELGGTIELKDQMLAMSGGGEDHTFELGTDYEMMGYGIGGDITAPAVFVGYSIASGSDGYSSYGEDDDLEGKIAVMYRFEPMNENGDSRWSDRGWSGAAGFNGKLRAAAARNPAGIIIVNPPEANDDRINTINRRGSRIIESCPVFMMSVDAGSQLLEAGDADGRTAVELRHHADEGGGPVELSNIEITMKGAAERTPVHAENVAGLLPGRGDLADELVVIGAHLDHLGMGDFGSREGGGKLHPGADDNASGSTAIIMLAKDLADDYANLEEGADARSILFMGFSAEESGLNGSRYYVDNPIRPIEDHVLMINFDMIGRITENKMSISSVGTGKGMKEWLGPIGENSELDVVLSDRGNGGSDHLSFQRKQIPVLFGAIAGLHGDYHTSRDTSDKMNHVGAARTVRIFRQILLDSATRAERFEFVEPPSRRGGGNRASLMSRIKVRMGIRPERGAAGVKGVLVGDVTEDSPAAEAGFRVGDILVAMDKEDVANGQELMERLTKYEPGDVIQCKVIRDDVELRIAVKLVARK